MVRAEFDPEAAREFISAERSFMLNGTNCPIRPFCCNHFITAQPYQTKSVNWYWRGWMPKRFGNYFISPSIAMRMALLS
ncbi:hypothetical protein CQ10_35555 [Bradyrhizobium valentinum]|nr:hypothetical protein CQ10_35555 [Bradyrhizobium valentinum]